jgi:hypothetical protein
MTVLIKPTINDPAPQGGGIALASRIGEPIENDNTPGSSPILDQQAKNMKSSFPDTCVFRRTGLISCYNCHGLTFASRRTRIWNSTVVRKLMEEDGYVRIKKRSEVRPGDIILYISPSGDVEHSGIILFTNSDIIPFAPPERPMLEHFLVLSKWGFSEEIVHRETMCPYEGLREFWRISNDLPEA